MPTKSTNKYLKAAKSIEKRAEKSGESTDLGEFVASKLTKFGRSKNPSTTVKNWLNRFEGKEEITEEEEVLAGYLKGKISLKDIGNPDIEFM